MNAPVHGTRKKTPPKSCERNGNRTNSPVPLKPRTKVALSLLSPNTRPAATGSNLLASTSFQYKLYRNASTQPQLPPSAGPLHNYNRPMDGGYKFQGGETEKALAYADHLRIIGPPKRTSSTCLQSIDLPSEGDSTCYRRKQSQREQKSPTLTPHAIFIFHPTSSLPEGH